MVRPVVMIPAPPSVLVPALCRRLPLVLNVAEAGVLAGMSRRTAYRAVHNGGFPVMRVGERLRVPAVTLLEQLGLALVAPLDAAGRSA